MSLDTAKPLPTRRTISKQWDKYYRELAEYNKKKAEHTDGDAKRSDGKKSDAKKSKDKDAAADKEPMPPSPPKRDLKLETLAEVLKGNIRVHMHCYRSDEMATMLDVADEFGFKIAAFHHAVEAYKIADRLAEKGVCAAMWADWWGFKMEAYRRHPGESRHGGLSGTQLRHRALGFGRWHSAVEPGGGQGDGPRRARGLGDSAGTGHPLAHIQSGEVAGPRGSHRHTGSRQGERMWSIWNGNPFSVYALAEQVFIDGALTFDRAHPTATPRSDFLLGRHIAESPL